MSADTSIPRNRLLETLPASLLERLGAREADVDLHHILIEQNSPVREFIFPHHGTVISLVRVMRDGGTVESGVVGFEGVATAQQLLHLDREPNEAMIQVAGRVTFIDAARLRDEVIAQPRLREPFLRYAAAFIEQVGQNVACNRLHSAEQRLAKWLLLVRQRAGSDDVRLTHEFLAHMLGIRRAGVSEAVGLFSNEGLIVHARNRISIRDLEGLRARACECAESLLALA